MPISCWPFWTRMRVILITIWFESEHGALTMGLLSSMVWRIDSWWIDGFIICDSMFPSKAVASHPSWWKWLESNIIYNFNARTVQCNTQDTYTWYWRVLLYLQFYLPFVRKGRGFETSVSVISPMLATGGIGHAATVPTPTATRARSTTMIREGGEAKYKIT